MADGRSLAPWPAYTQRQAAAKLGVSFAYLEGLANNPIPAVRVPTSSGNSIWLYQRRAIQRMAAALKGATE